MQPKETGHLGEELTFELCKMVEQERSQLCPRSGCRLKTLMILKSGTNFYGQ